MLALECVKETPESVDDPRECLGYTPESLTESPEFLEVTPENVGQIPEFVGETPESLGQPPESLERHPESPAVTSESLAVTPESVAQSQVGISGFPYGPAAHLFSFRGRLGSLFRSPPSKWSSHEIPVGCDLSGTGPHFQQNYMDNATRDRNRFSLCTKG